MCFLECILKYSLNNVAIASKSIEHNRKQQNKNNKKNKWTKLLKFAAAGFCLEIMTQIELSKLMFFGSSSSSSKQKKNKTTNSGKTFLPYSVHYFIFNFSFSLSFCLVVMFFFILFSPFFCVEKRKNFLINYKLCS